MKSAIVVPENSDCAFCAYLRGQRPYTIIGRNSEIATLVTREQRGTPHLMVIPVRHFATILDVNEVESIALMLGIQKAAAAIDAAYQRPGIMVWQNNGVPAHQSVGHLHFHVAGTLDNGGTNWGEVEKLSVKETDAIGRRIAPYLRIRCA